MQWRLVISGGSAWGVALTLIALVGLADTIVTQIILSEYAVSGGGANKVAAPPLPVAGSLVASGLLGLLLALDEWRQTYREHGKTEGHGASNALRERLKRLREAPHHLRGAWNSQMIRWRAIVAQMCATLVAVRHEGIRLTARGGTVFWLTALALGVSLAADIGAVAPASRPAAQWAWVASVALLLVAAGVQGRGVRISHRGHGGHGGHGDDTEGDREKIRDWQGVHLSLRGARQAGVHRTPLQVGMAQAGETPAVQARAWRTVSLAWRRWGDWMLVGVLAAGALALRLPDLTELPYVVHGDEAWNGLEALRWLNGGVPSLLSTGWYGLPVAGYGLPALVMRFAGADLWGLRLSSVLIGTLSIALLYALAREFTGRRVAFMAAALMTVSHLHIQFSRMGIHYIHGMTVVLLVLWLLVRALRRGSAVNAVLAAAAMSLALQVYFSARIVFVIVPLFLLGLVLLGTTRRNRYAVPLGTTRRNRYAVPLGTARGIHFAVLLGRTGITPKGDTRAWMRALGWLALGLVVAVGPLAVYFQEDVGALTGRPAEVLILNLTAYRRQTLLAQFGTTNLWTILRRQLAAVPLIPGGLADQSLQYGPHYAMLDPLVAALVLIGFWYAVCTLRRPLSLLLVLWVLNVVTLGGVLTIDMPWWPRLLAMLPALCLLAALALDSLLGMVARAATSGARSIWLLWLRWRWGRLLAGRPVWALPSALQWRGGRIIGFPPKRSLLREKAGQRAIGRGLGAAVMLAVVGFSLGQSIQHYYVQYPKSVNTDTYRTRYTDLAYYAVGLPDGTHVILYDSGDFLLDYSTVRLLAPNLNGTRVTTTAALRQALAKQAGPVVVIVSLTDVASFQQTLAKPDTLPLGSFQEVRDTFGVTAFYAYTIP